MLKDLVTTSPDVMGGVPVFTGTRVPVRVLLDHIETGQTLDDFLEGYPSVTREQAIGFLERAAQRLLSESA